MEILSPHLVCHLVKVMGGRRQKVRFWCRMSDGHQSESYPTIFWKKTDTRGE